jgi:hypothetical protein
MIVGIAVGVSLAVLIGVGIAVYFLCRKKNVDSNENRQINEKRTTSTVDDYIVADTIQSDHGINLQYPSIESKTKSKAQIAL